MVEWFKLCAKYVVLEVDDFRTGYTLNFVSQLVAMISLVLMEHKK